MFWISDFLLRFLDDPEIYGINAILVEGRSKMFGDSEHTSISKYIDFPPSTKFVKTLLNSQSVIRQRMLFSDVSIMKFLSIIIWLYSTNIPLITWHVQFFWSSVSFQIGDKHAFSLFHNFSDESLPNHSYVISPDVQSLNHMNMNIKNMIELLTRRPTTSLHVRWYHSESDLSDHKRIWRIT